MPGKRTSHATPLALIVATAVTMPAAALAGAFGDPPPPGARDYRDAPAAWVRGGGRSKWMTLLSACTPRLNAPPVCRDPVGVPKGPILHLRVGGRLHVHLNTSERPAIVYLSMPGNQVHLHPRRNFSWRVPRHLRSGEIDIGVAWGVPNAHGGYDHSAGYGFLATVNGHPIPPPGKPKPPILD